MNWLPIAFAAPWALAALVTLPVIWWLLRFTPPRPREVLFPPLRLLIDIRKEEEKPRTSPWWLTALRLLLATLLILALAGPTWNPAVTGDTSRAPIVVVMDDGWPAARAFEQRRVVLARLVDEAQRDQQPMMLVLTSLGPDQTFRAVPAAELRERVGTLRPQPFLPDRTALLTPLDRALREVPNANIVWFADGMANGHADNLAALFARAAPGRVTLYMDDRSTPVILGAPVNGADALTAPLTRLSPLAPAGGVVRALDIRGRSVATVPFAFEGAALETTARLQVPVELRNDMFRLEVENGGTAGGVQLLDERFRRRTVGIAAGASEFDSPLLSPLFILAQAMAPFADVRESRAAGISAQLTDFLDQQRVSTLILADVSAIPGDAHRTMERWLRSGGVLVRFAGTRLAASQTQDPFVPVKLRQTARILGGALSWEQPQRIGRFNPQGPFAGLNLPQDVTITRQILAEPEAGLAAKTWAELADGTPLVTAEQRGEGWIVLVHVTADPNWSSLPISGTFLDMLRRVIAMSAATSGAGGGEGAAGAAPRVVGAAGPTVLPPLRSLDATGASGPPPASAQPIAVSALGVDAPSREHPPGLYGRDDAFRALNAVRPGDQFVPLTPAMLPAGARVLSFAPREDLNLKPWLLAGAIALLILDTLIVLLLGRSGGRARRVAAGATAALAFLALVAAPTIAEAQQPRPGQRGGPPPRQVVAPPAANPQDEFALRVANHTRIAYVVTGLADVDEVVRAGMEGLTRILNDRTSLEPAEPIGVDLARDELAFFPMIYWPIDPRAPRPSAEAIARADQFMRNGGTIVFDTRDQSEARPSARGGFDTPGLVRLREILAAIEVPELEPVPNDHVITKAFYLINAFPGRFTEGPLWTERTAPNPEGVERPVRLADGVTPILITTNDFAGAWAMDGRGQPMLPLYGEAPRQREMSLRTGVNIMIYLLTGNYKADQVHVPDILQRLGQ